MLFDAFIYTGLSLLNQFFCDRAIIDKTLFYLLIKRYSMKATPETMEPGIMISQTFSGH